MALPVPAGDNNKNTDLTPIVESMSKALAVVEPSKAIGAANNQTASPIIDGEFEVIGEVVSDAINELEVDAIVDALQEHADKLVDSQEQFLSGIENNTGITAENSAAMRVGIDQIVAANAELIRAFNGMDEEQDETTDGVKLLIDQGDSDSKKLGAIRENTKVVADAIKEQSEDVLV